MKVLVDTCVWSLSLQRRKGTTELSGKELQLVGALAEGIRDGRVVMVGAVRQELLSGIRDARQFEKLRGILEAFPDEPMTTAIHVEAARLDNLCRAKAAQCGEVDTLLCAAALHYGWTILTSDTGLLRCIEVIENEGADARKLRE